MSSRSHNNGPPDPLMRHYEDHFLFMRSDERQLIRRSLLEERERMMQQDRDASAQVDRRPRNRSKRRA